MASVRRTIAQIVFTIAAFVVTFAVCFSLAANPQAPARPVAAKAVEPKPSGAGAAAPRPKSPATAAETRLGEALNPGSSITFDKIDRHGGDWYLRTNNDTGVLAWRGGYVLLAYVHMYEGTGQTRYLDKFVTHARSVVAMTDEARHVTDWRGESLPAWRCGIGLTVGALNLSNRHGRPVLRAISRYYNYNNQTWVRVLPGKTRSTFGLIVRNSMARRTPEVYHQLSLDRRSRWYFARIVNIRSRILTLKALVRPLRPGIHTPRPTTMQLTRPVYYHVAVQTGMLAYPLARFATIANGDPALAARYGADANAFLRAAQRAVAVHDREWVDRGSYGYYVFRRGDPVWCDGIEMPLNEELVLGRAILQLYGATGASVYRDRAAKMARLLKLRLRLDTNKAYLWDYWYGWGKTGWTPANSPSQNKLRYNGFDRIEDIRHGSLTNDFASTAADLGVVMTKRDKIRFANTFHANMRMPDGQIASNVIGSGVSPSVSMQVWVNGWFGLSSVHRDVQSDAEGALVRLLARGSRGALFLYGIARNIHARRVLAHIAEPMRAPGVRALRPAQGLRVSRDITMTVDVTGSVVGGVTFYIDRFRVAVDTTRPYSRRLHVSVLRRGWHKLRAVASDADGRTGVVRVRIYVTRPSGVADRRRR